MPSINNNKFTPEEAFIIQESEDAFNKNDSPEKAINSITKALRLSSDRVVSQQLSLGIVKRISGSVFDWSIEHIKWNEAFFESDKQPKKRGRRKKKASSNEQKAKVVPSSPIKVELRTGNVETETKGDNPFENFNFSTIIEHYQDSSIAKMMYERYLNAMDEYNANINTPFLINFPLPTSVGKTYSSALSLFIYAVMRACRQQRDDTVNNTLEAPAAFYVTHVINGLRETQGEIKKIIENSPLSEAQQAFIREKIHIFYGQEEILEHCNGEADLRELISLLPCLPRTLKSELGAICRDLNGPLNTSLKKAFTRPINQIHEHIKQHPELIPIIRKNKSLFYRFFPTFSLCLGDCYIAFLTTHKLFYPLKNITKGFNNTNFRNKLIFIDEVDAQAEKILEKLLEKNTIELIGTAQRIHSLLKGITIPELEKFDGLRESASKLVATLEQINEEYKTNYVFTLSKKLQIERDRPISLFDDRISSSLSSIKDDHFSVHHDNTEQRNIITLDEASNNRMLSVLINKLDTLINSTFPYLLLIAAQHYRSVVNKTKEDEAVLYDLTTMDNQVAEDIETCLSVMQLQDMKAHVFYRVFNFQKERIRSIKQFIPNVFDRGIKVTTLEQHSIEVTGCVHQALDTSPSAYLADMVDRNNILIGLSATSENESVLMNFSITYLKERLRDTYKELSRQEKKIVKGIYERNRQFQKHIEDNSIKISVNKVTGEEERRLPGVGHNMIKNEIELLFSNEKEYNRKRTLKLIKASKCFIKNGGYVHLSFLTADFSKERYKICNAYFKQKIVEIAKKYDATIKLFYVNASYLKHNDLTTQISDAVANGDKVVIITNYAAIGAGYNPQYKVMGSDYVTISRRPQLDNLVDIDSLYMEKPTSFIKQQGEDRKIITYQLYLHAIFSSLRQTDQLTEKGYKSANKLIAQLPFNIQSELTKRYTNTDDYNNAVWTIIEQCIGRIGRTANKRKLIQIHIDEALIDILRQDATSGRDRSLKAFEYNYVIESLTNDANTQSNQSIKRYKLNAIRTTKYSAFRIKKSVNGIFEDDEYKDADIEMYKGIKQHSLTSPQGANGNEYQVLLTTPHETKRYRYSYKGGDSQENMDSYLFYDDIMPNSREFSDDDAGLSKLMEHQFIYTHFKENEWATEFIETNKALTPPVYESIYKPALGEEATKAIMSSMGVMHRELEHHFFEYFDFISSINNKSLLIDVKNWSRAFSYRTKEETNNTLNRAAEKLTLMNQDTALLVRLWGYEKSQKITWHEKDGKQIGTINGLIDKTTNTLLKDNIRHYINAINAYGTSI